MTAKKSTKTNKWEERYNAVMKRKKAAEDFIAKFENDEDNLYKGLKISDETKAYVASLGSKSRYTDKELEEIRYNTNANVLKSRVKKVIESEIKGVGTVVTKSYSAKDWKKSSEKLVAKEIYNRYIDALHRPNRKIKYTTIKNMEKILTMIDTLADTNLSEKFDKQRAAKVSLSDAISIADLEMAIKRATDNRYDGEGLKLITTRDEVAQNTAEDILSIFFREMPAATKEGYDKYRKAIAEGQRRSGVASFVSHRIDGTVDGELLADVGELLYDFFENSMWWAKYGRKIDNSDFIDIFIDGLIYTEARDYNLQDLDTVLMNSLSGKDIGGKMPGYKRALIDYFKGVRDEYGEKGV